jgi:hypothetical protein
MMIRFDAMETFIFQTKFLTENMFFLLLYSTEENSGNFSEANKEDSTDVDGKISIVAKIRDGVIRT